MIMQSTKILSVLILLGATIGMTTATYAADRTNGRGTGPVIYVTSQAQYYDSIVLTDVPANGNFQQLTMTKYGLTTEYGPGEVGHLGGRWWLDLNGDGEMNDGDKFFLCPLLGPGRDSL